MKRHLVITSRVTISADPERVDELVQLAAGQERKRLEAYLYGHSTLVAVAHDVEPLPGLQHDHSSHRITQRALVVVQDDDAARCRYLADYQGGRLQSGSFGVEDYVEDETAARLYVLGDDAFTETEPTLAEALEYAANALGAEEVFYALGLDRDHLDSTFVTVDGVERPYTEADLEKDTARHDKIVELLRDAAKNASYS